eukprot:485947_1
MSLNCNIILSIMLTIILYDVGQTIPIKITCLTPNECVNQSLTGDTIYSKGYRGTSNSNYSMNSTSLSQCEAAFSCHSISFMQSQSTVECDGENSCSNAGFLQGPDEIDCDGSNSCMFTTVNTGALLRCDGDRACQNTYISGIKLIQAKGAYSLLNATIESNGVDSEIVLYAYHSGFGATVLCQANDTCTFKCSGNGCYNLYANCTGTCIFLALYEGSEVIFPITNFSLFNADYYTLESSYNSLQIITANDMECNNETALTYDHYNELEDFDNDTIIAADSTLCCRGSWGCHVDGQALFVESTSDTPYKLICSGRGACYEAIIENYMGNIFCTAAVACYSAEFNTTKALYCLASNACRNGVLYNTRQLICAAYMSCKSTVIYSSGLGQTHYYYFVGMRSAEEAVINCKENDECVLICGGAKACQNLVVHCGMGCSYRIECDDDSRCPRAFTQYPTRNPIMSPTRYPSVSPTLFTLSPTIILSANKSTVMNGNGFKSRTTKGDVVFVVILIGCVTLMPLLLMAFACPFHLKRRGTDRPGYPALFRFFGGIADWYTDAFWAYSLYIDGHCLWKSAFLFVFGSHLVSIMICIYWITKWRQDKHNIEVVQYASRYDKFVIFLSVVSGFYGATGLITSHLFHLRVLSLCLDDAQLASISTIRIFNQSLLENIPVLIIQILYLESIHAHHTDLITLLAIFFTIISIMVMVFTLVARFLNHMADRRREPQDDTLSQIAMEFILRAQEKQTIRHYHIHTHWLMANALHTALGIDMSQVKIRSIQKVSQGIKVCADLVLLHEEAAQHIFNELEDNSSLNQSTLYCSLRNECMDRLAIHLGCITLCIVRMSKENNRTSTGDNTTADQQRMLGTVEMQQEWNTISLNDDIHPDSDSVTD